MFAGNNSLNVAIALSACVDEVMKVISNPKRHAINTAPARELELNIRHSSICPSRGEIIQSTKRGSKSDGNPLDFTRNRYSGRTRMLGIPKASRNDTSIERSNLPLYCGLGCGSIRIRNLCRRLKPLDFFDRGR